MKILVAHNRYQQAGGEDKVVAAEVAMLARQGNDVELLDFANEAITGLGASAIAAVSSAYSVGSYRKITDRLRSFCPEVLHVHNFLPTMSPSVFFAAAAAHVPVVQTLHNYRLICANAMLFREGQTCERCFEERSFLPGVQHGCYRGSRAGSAIVGGTMALHARLGTWEHKIARYIALTEFAAGKLGAYRVPAEKIRVKPNFVRDQGVGDGRGGYALFVGRLSEEKGIATLIAADERGRLPLPLHVAGDGPWRERLQAAAARPGSRIKALGAQSGAEVLALMKAAAVLLVPSLTYEGFPMVIAEALSLGLPVIASRLGSLPEIVTEELFGMLHSPGDGEALVRAMQAFASLPVERVRAMRESARERYLDRYGEAVNYARTMEIYAEAIAAR